MIWIPVVVAS
jgi:hypothetical protein